MPPVCTRVLHGDGDERRRPERNRAQIPRRGMAEERAAEANRASRLPSDTFFELLAPFSNQVIADVRCAGVRGAFCDLPRALDALERHADLAIASGFGQFLDRVPVPVAA